jgi:hypothetical protein
LNCLGTPSNNSSTFWGPKFATLKTQIKQIQRHTHLTDVQKKKHNKLSTKDFTTQYLFKYYTNKTYKSR